MNRIEATCANNWAPRLCSSTHGPDRSNAERGWKPGGNSNWCFRIESPSSAILQAAMAVMICMSIRRKRVSGVKGARAQYRHSVSRDKRILSRSVTANTDLGRRRPSTIAQHRRAPLAMPSCRRSRARQAAAIAHQPRIIETASTTFKCRARPLGSATGRPFVRSAASSLWLFAGPGVIKRPRPAHARW